MSQPRWIQVCHNGHKIAHWDTTYRDELQDACGRCGADTYKRCTACNMTIKYHYEDDSSEQKDLIPDYCRNCGRAFPWTDDTEQFTEIDSSVLDREIVDRVVPEYGDGHYQSAVQSAFIILEERIREMGGFGRDVHGADLMTEAFTPDGGCLTFGETGGEQQGVMFLYRGAMQSLRNPASHRFIEEVDEDFARDVIHTVNLLLRLVEVNNPSDSE